jgi:hypothetical protein
MWAFSHGPLLAAAALHPSPPVEGTAGITLGSLSSTATGQLSLIGEAGTNLDPAQLEAMGRLEAEGAVSVVLDAIAIAATGGVPIVMERPPRRILSLTPLVRTIGSSGSARSVALTRRRA